MTIRIPSPTIASASGTSTAAFAGRSFWARTRTAITDHPGDAHDAQRHQHQHQPDARADAGEPELESRADALAAAPAEVPLERRELVDTCRDHHHAGGERPVRPVQRIHGDADECPDGKVGPDEERHGAHADRWPARVSRLPEPRPAASSPPSSPPTGRQRTRTNRAGSRRPCPSRSSAGPRRPRHAAASPSVAVSAAAVAAALALVMATESDPCRSCIVSLPLRMT